MQQDDNTPFFSCSPQNVEKAPHVSVLARPILSLLQNKEIKYILDGTVGYGGHAFLLLSSHPEIRQYIALDQDTTALCLAESTLQSYSDKVRFYHTNFSTPPQTEYRFQAILLDIGVSSMQLDIPERGFSFMHDGPLDMRMNQCDTTLFTAEDIINGYCQKELADIFYLYGEEHLSRPIAKMICETRKRKRYTSTLELALAIEKLIPRRGKVHPATKVFQALRIAVNKELEVLEKALADLPYRLDIGGQFFVISFHSLEDRIVKQSFQKLVRSANIEDTQFCLTTKKPIEADRDEIRNNRRSRSAKLRAIERKSE